MALNKSSGLSFGHFKFSSPSDPVAEKEQKPTLDTRGKQVRSLVVVQELSAFSLFPLIRAFRKVGVFHLRYWHGTPAGQWIASAFLRLGVAKSSAEIADVWAIDTEHSDLWGMHFRVSQSCLAHLRKVRAWVDRCLTRQSRMFRTICAANIVKDWGPRLFYLELLRNAITVLGEEMGIPPERIVLLSPSMKLAGQVAGMREGSSINMMHQPSLRTPLLFLVLFFAMALRDLFGVRRSTLPVTPRQQGVGITAAWGVEGGQLNDYFWWRPNQIPPSRLLYLFDPDYCQASPDLLAKARRLGIDSVVLGKQANPDMSRLRVERRKSFCESLQDVRFSSRMVPRCLFNGGLDRLILSQVLKHYLRSSTLAAVYRDLGLRVMFHNEEQADPPSLAMERADGIRVGFQWSCYEGPDTGALRPHHVFFVWGAHDAKICLDAGSVSQHVLVSGSPMQEMCSNPSSRQAAMQARDRIRKAGATCILTLFDSSMVLRRFYRFFLQWMLDDPSLGIVVKPKYMPRWDYLRRDGLDGLIPRALATKRFQVLSSDVSPGDAAGSADFSIGACTPSAVILAALGGARVLYLDYARNDDGPLEPYATLHRLGPKRCVFYDPELLKQAVEEYRRDPAANPGLGDASAVLQQFDPFRDGKASERIGEYVSWCLEGLDAGLSRDQALSQATRRYAARWGADSVIRGLTEDRHHPAAPMSVIVGDRTT